MEWSNGDCVLKEATLLEKRFEQLRQTGEREGMPLSLLPDWAQWAEDNGRFELELRQVFGGKEKVWHWSEDLQVEGKVVLAWRRSRERAHIPAKEEGRIGLLVREELTRLCQKGAKCEFKAWDSSDVLLAGDRLRTALMGEDELTEAVVIKPGRCGWRYAEDVVLLSDLRGSRSPGKWKELSRYCGTCVGSWEIERAVWSDERLRDAEARRQYPSVPPGFRKRRHFKHGPDVVVGDRSWFVDVGELDLDGENEEEEWKAELPRVVRMELEVIERRVRARRAQEDDCCLRELWRSDGGECQEFSVKAYEVAAFLPWREAWKDEGERRSLQRMEKLERELACMRVI